MIRQAANRVFSEQVGQSLCWPVMSSVNQLDNQSVSQALSYAVKSERWCIIAPSTSRSVEYHAHQPLRGVTSVGNRTSRRETAGVS